MNRYFCCLRQRVATGIATETPKHRKIQFCFCDSVSLPTGRQVCGKVYLWQKNPEVNKMKFSWLIKSESYKKGVIYSTGLNIIAGGMQFLNTLIIAFFFGTSIGTDIYFFVITVTILITTSIINGIDSIILIPRAMYLREREGEAASVNFLNFFILLYLVIGLVTFLIIIASPVVFYNIFSKFPPGKLEQYKYLLYAGSGLIFFKLINNFLGTILSSYKYFSITILTSLVTSLFSILITILFHKQLGIAGTLTAVAASYFINFLFLLAVMKLQLKWRFSRFVFVKDKHLWANIGLMQLNILPVWLRNYITLFLLTSLGEGIVSSVNLAQQVSGIIDALIIAQVLSVAGIKFNELYARMDMAALNTMFIKTANYLLLLLMPVVLIIFFYAGDITAIIFNRGSMEKNSLDTIGMCLRYLILLSPLLLLNSICTRIFSSTQVIRQGLLYSFSGHVIFLLLTILLINWLHLKGYLYSMLAGYCVIIFLFYRLFKLKLGQIDFDTVLKFGFKQLLINLIIALPVFYILKKLTDINNIILLCIAVFIQVSIIGLVNKKLLHFSVITDLFNGGNKPL